jgi:hypothetical protein
MQLLHTLTAEAARQVIRQGVAMARRLDLFLRGLEAEAEVVSSRPKTPLVCNKPPGL